MYAIYILECSDGTFYIGITNDMMARLRRHNGEIVGGAKYTRGRGPVILRYYEIVKDRAEATKKEYQLKKLSHAARLALCDSCTCRLL